MIQVTLHHGSCNKTPSAPQTYDLRWKQPLRAQCLLDLGIVCCHGSVTIRTLARPSIRPGMRNAVRLYGLIDKPTSQNAC